MDHLTEADLQAWIDRELDPDEHVRVTGHLEDCAACRRRLQALRSAAAIFSAAMGEYDRALMAEADETSDVAVPARDDRTAGERSRLAPRWVGRAAAIVLLLGTAAAAAMVPGSPLRALLFEPGPVVTPTPVAVEPPALPAGDPGASITVHPHENRLTVRVADFPVGTRLVLRLVDREEAIASLPDGAPDARFIVASGTLDVIGPGASAEGPTPAGTVTLRLPRTLDIGVVELDGETVARVSDGRLSTLRQVSSAGDDQAVFEVGG